MTLHRMRLLRFCDSDTQEVITTVAITERRWEQLCILAQRAGLTLNDYFVVLMERGFTEIEEAVPRLGKDEVRRRVIAGKPLQ